MFNSQYNINKIDSQIRELESLKNNLQNMTPAPINNYINTNTPQNMYELRKIQDNEEAEDIGILKDTIFISPTKMQIKKCDGTIEKYNLKKYYPIDEKDKKIDELSKKIEELEGIINEHGHDKEPNKSDGKVNESNSDVNVNATAE